MGRPSKLSPDQWKEVERRALAGETLRSLAREFGVDEAAIRRRVSPHTPQVRRIAEKLADAQTELAALPVVQQYAALSLADELRQIATSLAGAARAGSDTAHRLAVVANKKVQDLKDSDPLDAKNLETLKGVAALTKLANEAGAMGAGLLSAHKDRMKPPQDEEGDGGPVLPTFNLTLTTQEQAKAEK